MYVIADLEWVVNDVGHFSPTQIAASRVNSDWQETESISVFFKPSLGFYHDWTHVAYTGGTSEDFLKAQTISSGFRQFLEWLNDDDVIIWWYQESIDVLNKLLKLKLQKKIPNKMMVVSDYISVFLNGHPNSRGNSYKVAENYGVEVNSPMKHHSVNDVRVIRELFSILKFPQSLLEKTLTKEERQLILNKDLPFQYDTESKTIHIFGCENIRGKAIGHRDLITAIRKAIPPCDCCKEQYHKAQYSRNERYAMTSGCTYIYSPTSSVFHRYDCKLALRSKKILGTRKYDSLIELGKSPCKVCNPKSTDEHILKKESRERAKANTSLNPLNRQELQAVERQKKAFVERKRKLKDETLSQLERSDVYVLTQPRFAFFSARGYQTFHTKNCTKLQELSDLKGFPTYAAAIRAGLTPCRKCKPTAKSDAKVSIPFTNRIRHNENLDDLVVLCRDEGYVCSYDDYDFYVETPVGKWKIDHTNSPIKVEHINLVTSPGCTTYHKQPRLFLSLLDTFEYIKRHDNELKRQKEAGTVMVSIYDK